jgi:hypothetical protein
MASTWNVLPTEIPTDGQVVWVRLWSVYGEPVQMEWKEATETFRDPVTGVMDVPWYIVARWREV